MRTDTRARGVIAEVLAVLRDQQGFEIWWLSMDEQTRDDLTEELVDVLEREE